MNKIYAPKITYKNIISDEKRIEAAFSRLFNIARRNILEKRVLTSAVANKYTKVQHGRKVFNN